MCLVDLQKQQLQDGLKYVQQLRNAAVDHDRTWGEVTVAQPDALATILQDAWLVVEVSWNSQGLVRAGIKLTLLNHSAYLKIGHSSRKSSLSLMIWLQHAPSLLPTRAVMEFLKSLRD